jgi:hypothetical protein
MFKKCIRAYIDEELPEPIKTHFLEHATQCNACNTALMEMKSLLKVLSGLTPVTTSPEFNFTLRSRVRLEHSRIQNPLYRFNLLIRENIRTFLAVPVFMLVILAALFFYSDARVTFNSDSMISKNNSQNSMEQVRDTENSADEVVYVYYVLETVYPTDVKAGIFLNNQQTIIKLKPAARTASLLNF